MISFADLPAIDALSRQLKIDPQALRKARTAFFKRSLGANAALDALPIESRTRFGESVRFRELRDARRFDSTVDNASKLVSHTPEGFSIETVVLKPQTGRVALCVSSQVGCAAACEFCATGQMGVARNLTAAQIVDQVLVANEALASESRRVRNIVFMGMGEPMHNEHAVNEALAVLQSQSAFDHPASRILVSTVGVPDALVRTAERFPTTNYAISLHATEPATREQIIPLARKHSLNELQGAIRQLNSLQPLKTSVMIEYLMLKGLNDSPADAASLVDWLSGLRVHVNLIPYNPIDSAPHLQSSPRPTIESFGEVTRQAGHPTTIRYSLGRDIDAACGQLVRDDNREVARRLASESR